MRQTIRLLAMLSVLIASVSSQLSASAQHVASGLVLTLPMNTAARVFSMTPVGSTWPPGWSTGAFDDSS